MPSFKLHVPSRGQVTPVLFGLMLEPNFQRGPETWKWLSSMWIRTSCWKAYPTQAFEAPKWAMLTGTREYCNSATITTFTHCSRCTLGGFFYLYSLFHFQNTINDELCRCKSICNWYISKIKIFALIYECKENSTLKWM